MSRPVRDFISNSSLQMMGIPKQFCEKSIDDFETYGKSSLESAKSFVEEYLSNIEENLEENKGICFMGSNGVGKSFLSCIIMKEVYRHRYSCRRITFSSYINAYTSSWDTKDDSEYEKYKGVEFLVLEEIGKEIDSKIAKPILEDLLRYREEHGLVTVICMNLTPELLRELYGASICSLINGNMTVIRIVAEDRRKDVFDGQL